MLPENSRKDALKLELDQIIKTDGKATEIVNAALEKSREIEEQTKKERELIFADAEAVIEKIKTDAKEEQQRLNEERRAQAGKENRIRQEKMNEKMNDNRESYVSEIYGRIISS